MSTEQQRKMMECAAKACGLSVKPMEIKNVTAQGDDRFIGLLADEWPRGWFDPLTNPTDTAEMCAKLGICTLFFDIEQKVSCGFLAQDEGPTLAHIEPYGDSRLKAWMCAATMVAAKIGDLE